MRVAHRQHGHLDPAALADLQRPEFEAPFLPRGQAGGVEGHLRQIEDRPVHVDGHATVVLQLQLEPVVHRPRPRTTRCALSRARARSA